MLSAAASVDGLEVSPSHGPTGSYFLWAGSVCLLPLRMQLQAGKSLSFTFPRRDFYPASLLEGNDRAGPALASLCAFIKLVPFLQKPPLSSFLRI